MNNMTTAYLTGVSRPKASFTSHKLNSTAVGEKLLELVGPFGTWSTWWTFPCRVWGRPTDSSPWRCMAWRMGMFSGNLASRECTSASTKVNPALHLSGVA